MPWSEATPMRKLMMLSGASPKEILDFAARYPRRGLPRSPTRVRLRKDENCYPCVRSEMSPMSPVRTKDLVPVAREQILRAYGPQDDREELSRSSTAPSASSTVISFMHSWP